MEQPPPASGQHSRPRAIYFPWLSWFVFGALSLLGLWVVRYFLLHDVPYWDFRKSAFTFTLPCLGVFLSRPVLLFSGDKVHVIRCFGLYWRRIRAAGILKLVLFLNKGDGPVISRIGSIYLVLKNAESFELWFLPGQKRKIVEEFVSRWNIPLEIP
ncbi:MAG: hypothetical protein IJS32_07575 [Kiritimatiellae bacterium]|nr:hypothetical protein [Kiritimatiellia bacterium]